MCEEKILCCPEDGALGISVDISTLSSLLHDGPGKHLDKGARYRFCPNPKCHVVYYSDVGQIFTKADLKVSVYQKDGDGDTPICYCWCFTRQDIWEDLREWRTSKILAFILEQTRAGRSACKKANPQGYCCLSNVRREVAIATNSLHKMKPINLTKDEDEKNSSN